MTERAKHPTADEYQQLADRSVAAALILEADHGPRAGIAERRFAGYYQRRATETQRAAQLAGVRAYLSLAPADRGARGASPQAR